MVEPPPTANVQQVVPLLGVTRMERSRAFYVDGLGFTMTTQWMNEGRLRWCWLQREGVALMLQEYRSGQIPEGPLGTGVSLNFLCGDALALYHAFRARGIEVERPFVGNGMWVASLRDPDGYRLHFESPTDVPEETEYSETEHGRP